ncbi:MAG: hypothetical protein ACE5FD_07705 [Anaerolineae bacterium]
MNRKWLWRGQPWQAFKNFAIFFSFTMNLVLIIVLLLVAPLIIPIVSDVAVPIVGDLNDSFVQMNDAAIVQTIPVSDTIPIEFTLPLSQTTDVILQEDVELRNMPTTFVLVGGGGTIEGNVTLSLPEGLALPVALNMEVPVEQTIPVHLNVSVVIPLDETDLGTPFGTLKTRFGPLDEMLRRLPSSNADLIERILSGNTAVSVEPVSSK